jgi:hypothetical protein
VENTTVDQRISEINIAVQTAKNNVHVPPTIPIVPVRMLEAWFLFDISAIRKAAGNPAGAQVLTLPPLNSLENLSDPKEVLHKLLRDASELHGRRLKSFDPHSALHRIPRFTEDFDPLRALTAFQKLETDISQTISFCGWA